MQSRAALIAIVLSVFALPAAAPRVHADARQTQTLTALVGPHSLARDTNGDNLANAVAARVIVPPAPTPSNGSKKTPRAMRCR
jgi:hypothetical protein